MTVRIAVRYLLRDVRAGMVPDQGRLAAVLGQALEALKDAERTSGLLADRVEDLEDEVATLEERLGGIEVVACAESLVSR